MESILVNNVTASLKKRVVFYHLKGSFTASNRFVNDLSLHRTRDASLTATPTTVTIKLHLGLQNLDIYYKNYRAKLEKISVSGEISLKVKTNSFFIQLTFVFEEDDCHLLLGGWYIEALDDYDVTVSNLGPVSWTYGKIAGWLLKSFKSDIQ